MPALLPTTPEAASAGCELVTSDGRALALVSACLFGEAQGGLARLVLEQRFENPYDETLKVTYRMPLPADGAVSGYEFVIGERTVKGVIDKKRQARERFERAIVEGKTAALLEQERADIFTQQIGNIPAREAVTARITIDQRLVWLPEGEWELRFPTVIGPRYIGSADTAADVRATHIKVTDRPLAVTIQIELAIRDAIVAGAKPSSPSHLLERRPGEDTVIELKSGSRLDRDIVVRWPVATPEPGVSLAAARPASGDAYALLTIVPQAKQARPLAVPRDLIVLLDTSGSMSGGPLDKAKQVVAMLIDSLDEQDRLELIEFSNSPRRYLAEPVQATAKAKQAAIQWVRSRVADGGTEMRAGVIEALTTLRVGAQRQVVVVTDGYVGGEQQILEALNRRLPKSCRLHVLGVGSAVNRSLATSLARAGRGCEVIVGIDEDVERGAKRLLDRTRAPMLTNVEISGNALLRHAPAQIPDVFEGAPLVCALAIRPEGGELLVRGQLARDRWEQRITVPAQQPGQGNQAIVALYGRERVADVEANALFDNVDGEIEDLGLTFQIATRMTSWVAIDELRRTTGPSRDQVIPQELPYGTTASAFGLRGGSPMAGGYPVAEQAATKAGVMRATYAVDTIATFSEIGESGFDRDDEFADEEASVPPPAAYSRPSPVMPPASRMAPPPPASSRARSLGSVPRRPIADDFESEEPTGRVLELEQRDGAMPAEPEYAAGAPRQDVAPAKREQAELAREKAAERVLEGSGGAELRKQVIAEPEPAPATATLAKPVPAPATATLAKPGPAPVPAQARRPSRLVWLALLALLAAIAALIWWLVR